MSGASFDEQAGTGSPYTDAPLPGARGGYERLPTGPIEAGAELGVDDGPIAEWAPHPAHEAEDSTRLAPWALFAAIVALATSMFVGWGIPVAIVAVIAAIMS
ncbi:MAG: hypothetical protein WA971_06385, partial [Microbacterium sp.]